MSFRNLTLFPLLIVLTIASLVLCQIPQPDDDDIQSWNDLQLTIPIHEKVDIALTTTLRIGNNLRRFNEGRVGAGASVKLHKSFTTAVGYNFIEARNVLGQFRTEHRYHVNGVYKFRFKSFGLSHRSQYEYRVRSSIRAWRYRPSVTFEKSLPEKFISKSKFFITEEPFYTSTLGRFTRNRLSVGINKAINDNLTLDIYYLRQNDGISLPGDLHVIGTSWKLSL